MIKVKVFFLNICFLVFFVYSYNAYCQLQPTIHPSPNTSSILSFIDSPVNHFTGTPNISIPIYSFETNTIKESISLDYNPQNIKVDITASSVGLGWSLNVGGVISRVIKDAPDDSRVNNCNIFEEYNFPYDTGTGLHSCQRGFLYSIAEKNKHVITFDHKAFYTGIESYNLDLEKIYLNRKSQIPEDAILNRFGLSTFDWFYSDSYIPSGPVRVGSSRPVFNYSKINDLEPDIFYFNFFGYSGKFVFDVEDTDYPTISMIPYKDLKINYKTDIDTGKLISFTIKDDKGNTFVFKDVESVISLSQSLPQNGTRNLLSNKDLDNEARSKYNNSWWLSNVIMHTGEQIKFQYEDEVQKEISQSMFPGLGLRSSKKPENLNAFNTYYQKTNAKKITKIYKDNLVINFNYGELREDLVPDSNVQTLKSIEVFSKTKGEERRKLIKKIDFDYDYFLSSENKTINYFKSRLEHSEDVSHNGNKRLRLRGLLEYGKTQEKAMKYEFEYNYYDQGNEYASFKKFPNKYSYNIDIWGFANGANNKTPVPSLNIYPDHYPKGDIRAYNVYEKKNFSGRHLKTVGGNRLPNKDYMDIGVLTKIKYPTGGYTKYFYKPYEFIYEGEQYFGGGIAIDKIIKQTSDNAKSIIVKYDYNKFNSSNITSGRVVSIPFFADLSNSYFLTRHSSGNNLPVKNYKGEIMFNNIEDVISLSPDVFSQSISSLGSGFENNFGYTNVKEIIVDQTGNNNGITEYTFSFPAALDDINNYSFFERTKNHNFFIKGNDLEQGNFDYYPTNTNLSYPNPPNPNYDWNRGLLLSKKVKNLNGKLIEKIENFYENYFPHNKNEPNKIYGVILAGIPQGLKSTPSNRAAEDNAIRVSNYYLNSNVSKVLTTKKITNYIDNKIILKTFNYEYDGFSHMLQTKIKEDIGNNKEKITEYKYPFDYKYYGQPRSLETFNIYSLKGSNINYLPIETTQFLKKETEIKLIKSSLIRYKIFNSNNIIKPYKILNLFSDSKSFFTSYIFANPNNNNFVYHSDYKELQIFKSYDTKGNPLEVQDIMSGITTSYFWGYNKTYPIIKADNVNHPDLESIANSSSILPPATSSLESFVLNLDNIATDTTQRARWKTYNDKLRAALPSAMITTYTYAPLIGMTSQTDPRGYTTYYEYDEFNRLKNVKDADGNILSNNEYNYKN